MEREKPDQVAYHIKRMVTAGIETGLFALAGLIYPPAHLGMLVTIPEALRQETLTFKEIYKKLRQIDENIRLVDEHLNSHDHNDEPIPVNPETATPEEIEAYKKTVLDAAQQPPDH